jgi:hypothetical protein
MASRLALIETSLPRAVLPMALHTPDAGADQQ